MDGKKILVFSDSHGDIKALTKIFKWMKKNGLNDAAFLGDGAKDIPEAKAAAGFSPLVQVVRGNCDYDFSLPESALLDFGGSRFFMSHGHRASLPSGFDILLAAASNNETRTALFGHTHVPFCKTINGILLINPGSIGRPRSDAGPTFVVIECLPKPDKETQLPLKIVFWDAVSLTPL